MRCIESGSRFRSPTWGRASPPVDIVLHKKDPRVPFVPEQCEQLLVKARRSVVSAQRFRPRRVTKEWSQDIESSHFQHRSNSPREPTR